MTSVIDLSQVAPPDVVETIDYDDIRAALLADFQERYPEYGPAVESDPVVKMLEVAAYRETVLRQRINEAGQAVMLPYATGADLDNLATLFGVQRLLITPADPDPIPPVAAVYEPDAELRRRVQLSLEGLSVAGPAASYVYHALSADGRVLDASASSPSPGDVLVTVLARFGDGAASDDLLAAVDSAVSAEDVRPLTDHVTVQTAKIVNYSIDATLYLYDGPDSSVVIDQARKAIETYAANQHRLGHDVTLSGVYAALHQPGTQRVELRAPEDGISIDDTQAAYCPPSSITLSFGGVDE